MPASPTTSVVISTRDRPDFVTTALDAVLACDPPPAEVVVVDQSRVPHPVLARRSPVLGPNVRYLWPAGQGLSRSRNAGIAAASGEVVALLDDDVLVPPDWIGCGLAALAEEGPRSIVTGRVEAGAPEVPGAFAPSTKSTLVREVYEGRIWTDVLSSNVVLPKAAWAEIGGFDERLGVGARFPSSEDNDFGYRLLEAGYRIVYRPDLVVEHRSWRRSGAFVSLRWSYGRGQGAYFAKHLSRDDLYMARRLDSNLRRHLRRGIRRAGQGHLRDALGDLAYSYGVSFGALEWLLTERR